MPLRDRKKYNQYMREYNQKYRLHHNNKSKEVQELKAKIEAAKPLLEKWCKECGEAEFENTCQNDCVVYELKALLFPRNDEQSCVDCKDNTNCFRDKTIVCPNPLKENTTP